MSTPLRDMPAVPLTMRRPNAAQAPLVMISSYVPRKCGIATFTEEALEFIHRHMPGRPVHVIAHLDGRGYNVHPVIDQRDPEWYLPVAGLVHELQPYAVHIQHEYGLYEVLGPDGPSDRNAGFLRLLELIDWMLLAAGNVRHPKDTHVFETYRARALELQARGLAQYFEFNPRGDVYYQVMGSCDVVALPSVDETQSGTLARIFALNRPYVTSAPVEGLTAQTLESEAGLLFTNEATLRRALLHLMCDAPLRAVLSANGARYVRDVVSWDLVAQQYLAAYERANATVEATLSARAVS